MEKKDQQASERRCIATGQSRPKSELMRFVVGPDGALTPDLKARLPGRGVWITARQDCLQDAVKRNLFQKGLKCRLVVSSEIDQQVELLLRSAALGALKMANKAGSAIYGFTKLMAAFEKKTIIGLIHAEEASRPEAEKLDYKFRTKLEQRGEPPQTVHKKPFLGFNGEELSLAFGAVNVIHAGLVESGSSRAALMAMERLQSFRSAETWQREKPLSPDEKKRTLDKERNTNAE